MPPNSGVAKMALSAFGDSVAIATARGGLHSVDLVDLACTVTEIAQLPAPIGALTWNPATAEVYAASGATIVVLHQTL